VCEAYDAQVAFVIAAPLDGGSPEVLGAAGLEDAAGAALVREPLVAELLSGNEMRARTAQDMAGLPALALAPFAAETGERAVIGVARLADRPFGAPELRLLEAVVASVGHALERDRRAAQQAALASAAGAVHASLDIDAVLTSLCAQIVRAFGADVALASVGDDCDGYAAIAAHGLPKSFIGLSRDVDEGMSGQAMATAEPVVSNAYEHEGHAALRGVRSGVAVPMFGDHGVDGALEVGFRRERPVGAVDAELLVAFADLAAVACRNADALAAARGAAARDSLTGCLNHGALQARLHEEISRAERGGGPVTLALIDLDDFKSINEHHGHLVGDAALRSVGELLRGSVRMHDQVARLGGDEFALLLTATEDESERIIDRALQSLRGTPMPAGGELAASGGIAQWRPGAHATGLIDQADRALRAAKRQRSGVAVARPGEEAPAQDRSGMAAALGAKLSGLRDGRAITAAAAGDLHQVLGFPCCRVAELRNGEVVVVAAAGGAPSPAPGDDEEVIVRCLHERRPVLAADASVAGGMRSELAVPLYVGGRLWGAVDVRSPRVAAFDADDAQVVQTVADHAGAALLKAARVLERR
jgi:diguanylate cyclase (GGDEF)-like protein